MKILKRLLSWYFRNSTQTSVWWPTGTILK